MPKIKTYTLINFKFLFATLLFLLSCFICTFCIFSVINFFPGFFSPNYKIKFFTVFFYLLLFYLFYRCGQLVYMYLRYFWHEKFTRIIIDYQNETITTINNSNSNIFNSDNLKLIEFHLSTKNHRNPLYDFGFTKLCSHNGKEIIITSLILNYTNIENILDGVKKIKKLDEVIYLP